MNDTSFELWAFRIIMALMVAGSFAFGYCTGAALEASGSYNLGFKKGQAIEKCAERATSFIRHVDDFKCEPGQRLEMDGALILCRCPK